MINLTKVVGEETLIYSGHKRDYYLLTIIDLMKSWLYKYKNGLALASPLQTNRWGLAITKNQQRSKDTDVRVDITPFIQR